MSSTDVLIVRRYLTQLESPDVALEALQRLDGLFDQQQAVVNAARALIDDVCVPNAGMPDGYHVQLPQPALVRALRNAIHRLQGRRT